MSQCSFINSRTWQSQWGAKEVNYETANPFGSSLQGHPQQIDLCFLKWCSCLQACIYQGLGLSTRWTPKEFPLIDACFGVTSLNIQPWTTCLKVHESKEALVTLCRLCNHSDNSKSHANQLHFSLLWTGKCDEDLLWLSSSLSVQYVSISGGNRTIYLKSANNWLFISTHCSVVKMLFGFVWCESVERHKSYKIIGKWHGKLQWCYYIWGRASHHSPSLSCLQ